MKNIVYSGNWADSSWTSFNDYTTNSGNKHNFKVTGPSIAVGIYSGNDTDIRFPLISQTGKGVTRAVSLPILALIILHIMTERLMLAVQIGNVQQLE